MSARDDLLAAIKALPQAFRCTAWDYLAGSDPAASMPKATEHRHRQALLAIGLDIRQPSHTNPLAVKSTRHLGLVESSSAKANRAGHQSFDPWTRVVRKVDQAAPVPAAHLAAAQAADPFGRGVGGRS